MTFIDDIETDARNGLIAAWRYLAYLDDEKRFLLHAIKPDWRKSKLFIPLDSQVGCLNPSGPRGDPLSRAPEVLSFLGMDPYADDAWVGVSLILASGCYALRRRASRRCR